MACSLNLEVLNVFVMVSWMDGSKASCCLQRELAAGREGEKGRREETRSEEREIATTSAEPTAAILRADNPKDFGFGGRERERGSCSDLGSSE